MNNSRALLILSVLAGPLAGFTGGDCGGGFVRPPSPLPPVEPGPDPIRSCGELDEAACLLRVDCAADYTDGGWGCACPACWGEGCPPCDCPPPREEPVFAGCSAVVIDACAGLDQASCVATPGCVGEWTGWACPAICLDDGNGGCLPCETPPPEFYCRAESCFDLDEGRCHQTAGCLANYVTQCDGGGYEPHDGIREGGCICEEVFAGCSDESLPQPEPTPVDPSEPTEPAEPDACWGAWLDEAGNCRTPADAVYPAECCYATRGR